MTDFSEMSNAEMTEAYNKMRKEADEKFGVSPPSPLVKKFTTRTEGIRRCTSLEAMLKGEKPEGSTEAGSEAAGDLPASSAKAAGDGPQQETAAAGKAPRAAKKGKTTMAKAAKKAAKGAKKAAKKGAAKKGAKKAAAGGAARAPRNGVGDMRITQVSEDASRREGTRAHTVFNEMKAWVKRNPTKTVAELMAATGYRTPDYKHDLAKGHIKVAKA